MLLGPWLWGFAVHALGVLGAIIIALLTYSIVVYTIIKLKKKSSIYVISVITFVFFWESISVLTYMRGGLIFSNLKYPFLEYDKK